MQIAWTQKGTTFIPLIPFVFIVVITDYWSQRNQDPHYCQCYLPDGIEQVPAREPSLKAVVAWDRLGRLPGFPGFKQWLPYFPQERKHALSAVIIIEADNEDTKRDLGFWGFGFWSCGVVGAQWRSRRIAGWGMRGRISRIYRLTDISDRFIYHSVHSTLMSGYCI